MWVMRSKLVAAVCAIWCCISSSSWAEEPKDRFVEIPQEDQTTIFDLSTVQLLQPGRFTILGTSIAHPDVMEYQLKVLQAIEPYCSRTDGKYPPTPQMLAMGPPDVAVDDVRVSESKGSKLLLWKYPYAKLRNAYAVLSCTEPNSYMRQRGMITNGYRARELFDCKRGVWGLFVNENADLSEVVTHVLQDGTFGAYKYELVCYAVTNEFPYRPKRSDK